MCCVVWCVLPASSLARGACCVSPFSILSAEVVVCVLSKEIFFFFSYSLPYGLLCLTAAGERADEGVGASAVGG